MRIKNKATIKGKYKIKTFRAGTKELLRETDWISNLIVLNNNSGLNIFIKNLIGDFTNNLEITKAKIGDNNTPPANSDTDLKNTIVDNILVAVRTETDVDEATFQFFIPDAELPDGTYREFGIFCGERLFARSIFNPAYSKSSGEDTLVEYVITTSNT